MAVGIAENRPTVRRNGDYGRRIGLDLISWWSVPYRRNHSGPGNSLMWASAKPMEKVFTGSFVAGHGTNHQCGIDATAQERAQGTSAISLRRTLSSNICAVLQADLCVKVRRPRRPPPRAGSNNSRDDRARVTGHFHPRARGKCLKRESDRAHIELK